MTNVVATGNMYMFTSDAKVINKMIVKFKDGNTKLHHMVHAIAVSCVLHAVEHGNVTPTNTFIKAFSVGSEANGWRLNALRDWLEAIGPFSWSKESKSFVFSKQKFEVIKAAGGIDTSKLPTFWDRKPEPEYRPFDLNAEIIKLVKMAETKANEKDEVKRAKNKIPMNKLEALKGLVNLGTPAAA